MIFNFYNLNYTDEIITINLFFILLLKINREIKIIISLLIIICLIWNFSTFGLDSVLYILSMDLIIYGAYQENMVCF